MKKNLFLNNLVKLYSWNFLKYFLGVLVLLFVFYAYYFLFVGSFSKFTEGKTITLPKGTGAKSIGLQLEDEGVVPSGTLLTVLVVALGREERIVSGPYYFEKKEGLWVVLRRITSGDFKTKALSVTFPEGFTVLQITERLKNRLKNFKADDFYAAAKDKEGYLFPETYYFMPDAEPKEVLSAFEDEFDKNISSLKNLIKKSDKKLNEIIIMASILEREVRSLEDKKIVAGILYKRMEIGMPLQVDATLAYERGLASHELSIADLRKDSLFNTYTNKGLPPAPISNPGINAIKAALEPTSNQYLYFLTDGVGNVHYARTHDEHVANKAKYLY